MSGWLGEFVQGAVAKTQAGLGDITEGIKDKLKERKEEVDREAAEIKAQNKRIGEVRALPWELDEEKSIVADDLMEKVLLMSLNETIFLEEPADEPHGPTRFTFDMERHVQIITRLLTLDPNLAKMHYRLSSKIDESVFWGNYFHRCALLRVEVGADPPLPRKSRVEVRPNPLQARKPDKDSSRDAAQAVGDSSSSSGGGGGGGGGSSSSGGSGDGSSSSRRRRKADGTAVELGGGIGAVVSSALFGWGGGGDGNVSDSSGPYAGSEASLVGSAKSGASGSGHDSDYDLVSDARGRGGGERQASGGARGEGIGDGGGGGDDDDDKEDEAADERHNADLDEIDADITAELNGAEDDFNLGDLSAELEGLDDDDELSTQSGKYGAKLADTLALGSDDDVDDEEGDDELDAELEAEIARELGED